MSFAKGKQKTKCKNAEEQKRKKEIKLHQKRYFPIKGISFTVVDMYHSVDE